jgi:hypothetical protein
MSLPRSIRSPSTLVHRMLYRECLNLTRREPCAAGWAWGVSVQFVVGHISHRMSRGVLEKVTYTSLDHTVPREEQDRVAGVSFDDMML